MFNPIKNYTGYNHVLGASGLWIHPINGNAYTAVVEQLSGIKQNLSIYRLPGGSNTWELVKEYKGTVDSQAQITFGGVGIGPGGNMIVVTSLIIPGVPRVTNTGFVGCWIRETGIDDPYTLGNVDTTGLEQSIVALEARIDILVATLHSTV